MVTYTISHCTVADGAALSQNNIPAFWEDPNWILAWNHTTLEKQVIEVAKRYPRNLINDRETNRHEKAIDPETGRLVGYARWIIPPSYTTTADGEPAWPEALVPAVGEEEEAEIRRVAATAVFNPNKSSDALDPPVQEIKLRILARKPYVRLDYLAVHPENKGKGIATALVQSGMRQAEKMGLDIFILAFKAGVGVYKQFGFRIEQEIVQDDSPYGGNGEYGVYFMIYEQNVRSGV